MSSKYLPHIDGLRAIAVLSVIIFHLNASFLSGGFIGVDIFFVISGYLITSNIFPQINNNTFTFKDFYTRRIKRILPSLYFVIFVTLSLGYFMFLQGDARELNKTVTNIVIFWANHHFAKGRDYFSPLSNENPLLHTWSLAIEEQFYFFIPILFFFLTLKKVKKEKILYLFIFLTILSFFLANLFIYLGLNSWAYYSLPTRYGELMLGSLCSIQKIKNKNNHFFISLIGFMLIFPSFVLVSEQTPFPGITALVPCIGALILLLTNNKYAIKILSVSWLVFIGQLSYQLYLWHWPVLAFTRYFTGKYHLSGTQMGVSILLTFSLSFLSWKYIEKPIRYMNLSFKKTLLYFYFAPTVFVVLLILISNHLTFKSRVFSKVEFNSYGEDICHGKKLSTGCIKGNPLKPKLLLIGDSHAAHLNSFIDKVGKKQNWGAYVASSPSCSPVLGLDTNFIASLKQRESCDLLVSLFIEKIDSFNIIAISSRWDFQLGLRPEEPSDPHFLEKLQRTLDLLLIKNKKVFIFSQIPLKYLSPQREELFWERLGIKSKNELNSIYQVANKKIRDLSLKYPNVTFIDISNPLLILEQNNENNVQSPLYKDHHHLNIYGSTQLADYMLNESLLNDLKIIGL